MVRTLPELLPAFFVSADWSKDLRKRSVHVADVGERRVGLEARSDWNLGSLLELARSLSRHGPVLVGLDMVFGVPAGYWGEVLEVPRWQGCGSFLDWLGKLELSSGFFKTVYSAEEWRADRPFFHVPKGKGGLRSITNKVEGGLLRPIDKLAGAKPMFAVSGIPGTVGSGTRDLWMELIPCLTNDRDFAVWPFDGELEVLLATRRVVLAESYPGLAYAVALAGQLPTHRLVVSKKKRESRERACDLLERAPWVLGARIDLGDLDPARADEDAFDSHFTAAAVLRCLVEGLPLCDPQWIDEEAEGGMLLAGPVDPDQRARRFMVVESVASGSPISSQAGLELGSPAVRSGSRRRRRKADGARDRRGYVCPIPGCEKVFSGGRGGWDAHVGSRRMHPEWHPEVGNPEDRKRLFREEHEPWFR